MLLLVLWKWLCKSYWKIFSSILRTYVHTHTSTALIFDMRWEKQMNSKRVSSFTPVQSTQKDHPSYSYQWTTESCFSLNITTAHARPFKTENFSNIIYSHNHLIVIYVGEEIANIHMKSVVVHNLQQQRQQVWVCLTCFSTYKCEFSHM